MLRVPLVSLLPILAAATLLAVGCGGYGDEDEGKSSSTPQPQAVPELPQADEATGTVPVDDFNRFLDDARPTFATSALKTAIEFTHAGEGQVALTSVIDNEGPEGGAGESSVSVTRDGLADDSVRAVRYELVLDRTEEGRWQLRSAQRLQRCQPGRGHQNFSPQLCT